MKSPICWQVSMTNFNRESQRLSLETKFFSSSKLGLPQALQYLVPLTAKGGSQKIALWQAGICLVLIHDETNASVSRWHNSSEQQPVLCTVLCVLFIVHWFKVYTVHIILPCCRVQMQIHKPRRSRLRFPMWRYVTSLQFVWPRAFFLLKFSRSSKKWFD